MKLGTYTYESKYMLISISGETYTQKNIYPGGCRAPRAHLFFFNFFTNHCCKKVCVCAHMCVSGFPWVLKGEVRYIFACLSFPESEEDGAGRKILASTIDRILNRISAYLI